MIDDLRPPYRIAFDNARDPYSARNALGIMGTGAGFITSVTAPLSVTGGNLTIDLSGYQPIDADLTAIAALTGTNTIYYRSAANTWSPVVVSTGLAFSGGNLTATGGNVSNSGTPAAGQLAEWVTATTIKGVSISSQLDTRSLFRASMSANQTAFSAGTYFQVLFNTAGQNVGGHFNTGNFRWTPPAGRVMLTANIWASNGAVGAVGLLALRKNGSAFLEAANTINALGGVGLTGLDVANGTDYYEIFFQFTTVGGGGGTVNNGVNSWFAGALL